MKYTWPSAVTSSCHPAGRSIRRKTKERIKISRWEEAGSALILFLILQLEAQISNQSTRLHTKLCVCLNIIWTVVTSLAVLVHGYIWKVSGNCLVLQIQSKDHLGSINSTAENIIMVVIRARETRVSRWRCSMLGWVVHVVSSVFVLERITSAQGLWVYMLLK